MKDDDVIDLRKDKPQPDKDHEEPEFRIDREHSAYEAAEVAPVSNIEEAAARPYDKVKVKFERFVNLVMTHQVEEVFDKHREEDVIVSTDLLTDLANSHEEKTESRTSLIFVLGIALGIAAAWIIIKI